MHLKVILNNNIYFNVTSNSLDDLKNEIEKKFVS